MRRSTFMSDNADAERIKNKIRDLQAVLPTYKSNLARATTDSEKMNWKGKVAGLENEIEGYKKELYASYNVRF
jgi:hypothetical protein